MRVAVAGGTGWSGKRVAASLRARGHQPVVLSRSTGVDLTTGHGLDERLDGVEAVIDVSNVVTRSAAEAVRFFEAATSHLLRAEQRAGIGHHVVLSIVGCDRVDLGYYFGKRRQEELVLGGPVPVTVLRATQFHEFAAQMLRSREPVVRVPRMRSQPVALTEVADHLADLATGEALGRAPEMGGPEPDLWMDDMVSRLATVRGDDRLLERADMPDDVARQINDGGLLPTAPGPRGRITFGEWLRSPDAQDP